MKKVFLLSLLILGFSSFGQQSVCSLSEVEQNVIKCLGESPTINTMDNDLIHLISDAIAIAPNFTYKYCPNTRNAAAVINPLQNNARYIIFDADYFGKIYGNKNSAAVFIIAHEIGHHINGHTIPTRNAQNKQIQNQELEADYFAGFIMYQLGGNETDILEAIDGIPDPLTENGTHPKNYKRKDVALKGFNNQANKFKAFTNRITNDANNRNKVEIYKDLMKSFDNYVKTSDSKYLDIADYLLNKIDDGGEYFNEIRAFINYKNKRYLQALNFYQKNALKDSNSENIVIFLDILTQLKINSADVATLIEGIESKTTNPSVLYNIGVYYHELGNVEKSKKVLKTAYSHVQSKSDDILKADVLFAYSRALFDELRINEKENYAFPKMLTIKAKTIIEKYPENSYSRLNYIPILFQLANIYYLDRNYDSAVRTFKELLSIEKDRTDLIYKSNSTLGSIYAQNERFPEAIQSFTNAINYCNDLKLKGFYYFQRAEAYANNKNENFAYDDIKSSCELGFTLACKTISEIK